MPATATKSLRALLFLIALIPAAVLLPQVMRTWVNMPFHDDWGTPGGQLVRICQGKFDLALMFSQHNESRPFFPRLVWIPLAWFGGWDVRRVVLAAFAMVCVASILLRRFIRRMPSITPAWTLVVWFVMNLILFWPNSEIWTYANAFMMVWPPVLLLCALSVNLSARSLREKVLWNSLLATVATYSWSNGMALWLLAVPLTESMLRMRGFAGGRDRKQAGWYLFYALAAVVNAAFYFHNYRRPAGSPPPTWDLSVIAAYFFTWTGGFFGDERMALPIGIGVTFLFLALAAGSLRLAFRKRDARDFLPWLVLGFYAIASGVVASIARSGLGESQAMSPRYSSVSGYLYISVAGMGWLVARALAGGLASWKLRALQIAGAIACALCISFAAQSYGRGLDMLETVGEHRSAFLAAWQWSRALPANPALALILENTRILEAFGTTLEQHHILRIPRWDPGIMAGWDYTAKAADAGNGVFVRCGVTPDRWVQVSGWARRPGGGPADYVLITVCEQGGIPRPWTILPANLKSPEVAERLKDARMAASVFRMVISMNALPKSPLTFAAWAVDMKQPGIRPLAGTFIVNGQ